MTGVKHRPWLLQSFQRTDRLGPFVKYDSIPSVCVLLICRTREKSQNTTTWLFESFNFFNGTFSWSSCSTAASRRWQQSCTYQWPHDCWSLREWLQLELHPLPSPLCPPSSLSPLCCLTVWWNIVIQLHRLDACLTWSTLATNTPDWNAKCVG